MVFPAFAFTPLQCILHVAIRDLLFKMKSDLVIFLVKEKTTGPRMASLVLKLMIPNLDLLPDLISVSTSPEM